MKRKTKFLYNGILLTAVGLAMRGTQLLFGAYIARTLGAEGVGLNTCGLRRVHLFSHALLNSAELAGHRRSPARR